MSARNGGKVLGGDGGKPVVNLDKAFRVRDDTGLQVTDKFRLTCTVNVKGLSLCLLKLAQQAPSIKSYAARLFLATGWSASTAC